MRHGDTRAGHRPVAVGIRLHDHAELRARLHALLDYLDILSIGSEIDLCPGSPIRHPNLPLSLHAAAEAAAPIIFSVKISL